MNVDVFKPQVCSSSSTGSTKHQHITLRAAELIYAMHYYQLGGERKGGATITYGRLSETLHPLWINRSVGITGQNKVLQACLVGRQYCSYSEAATAFVGN